MEPPVAVKTPLKPDVTSAVVTKPVEEAKPTEDKTIENEAKKEEPKKVKVVRKQLQKKTTVETEAPASKPEKTAETIATKPAETKSEKTATGEKSGWEAVKESVANGSERKCSQAEIAMNQCR
jgi:hypothetical protein